MQFSKRFKGINSARGNLTIKKPRSTFIEIPWDSGFGIWASVAHAIEHRHSDTWPFTLSPIL